MVALKDNNPKDDARVKILKEAARLFAQGGFAATSTREIAKATGLNVSLISYYFGGKEGLYRAVIEDFATKVRTGMDSLIDEINQNQNFTVVELEQFLGKLVDRFLSIHWDSPEIVRIMLREKASGMPFAKEIHANVFDKVASKVADIIRLAQGKGFVRKDLNPKLFLALFAESVNGFLAMQTIGIELDEECRQFFADKEQFKEQTLKIFLRGIIV